MRVARWLTASVLTAAVVAGIAAPAQAAPAYPKADGRCVDQTGVLGPALCGKVTAVLLRDEKSTSDEIAVAVVPSTGDSSIEAWSTGLFNTWGVGEKGTDNGVLLVVALDEHKARLETGRGAKKRIDDSEAATIVHDVTSHFAEKAYALGILTGLDDVRRHLGHTVPANDRLTALATTAPAPGLAHPDGSLGPDASDGSQVSNPEGITPAITDNDSGPLVPLTIGGIVFAVLLVVAVRHRPSSARARRSSRRRRRSSTRGFSSTGGGVDFSTSDPSSFGSFDSSSSDSSSFGGGSSDGGGATGSW
jgi:uncharacterized protein